MKTLLNILFLLFCSSGLLAQATINSSTVLMPGESAPIHFGNGFWNPGPSGASQNWDFSTVGFDASWDWRFYDPSETIFADSFPSANMAFLFPQGDSAGVWEYYLFENNNLFWLGAASVLSADSSVFYQIMEEDPDQRLSFPFTYGDSFDDQSAGVNWVALGGLLFKQTRHVNSSHEVDSYGSLTTPYGTFNNVVRVKTTESIRDTLKTIVPIESRQEITRYTWYSSDERYVLMHMDSIAILSFGGTVDLNFAHMYRSGEITTSLEEDRFAVELDLNAFPNPAQQYLNLSYKLETAQKVRVSLRNIIGQELVSVSPDFPVVGEQQMQIDLQGIGAGYYLLSVETSRGIASKKVQIR